MTFLMIMGLWSFGIVLLIAFALYRAYRIETTLRITRALAAKANVHEECSMVCESCGRYLVHPQNSVR